MWTPANWRTSSTTSATKVMRLVIVRVYLIDDRARRFIDLLGDVLQRKPKVSDGVDTVIIVDGVPQVNPERFDKLKVVITKIFAQFGKIINDYYPKTENGHTKG